MRCPAVSLLLFAVVASACSGLHQVTPDAYRGPQMHEDLLARTMESHQIRSVLCLRGSSRSTRATERAALGTGAVFWNVPMSATNWPSPQTLLALWDFADRAERPLLMHCRAGVDRTGLASAIVLLHDTGDLEAARGQLDLIPYGHIAWSETGVLDEVLDRYEPYAENMPFTDWVTEVYAVEFDTLR